VIQFRAIGNPGINGMKNKYGLLFEANKADDIASEPSRTELPSVC